MSDLKIGSPAPDFELPDQNGRPIRLSHFRGKSTVVLYFYPKDDTSGCTAEACRFRDDDGQFRAAGAQILGVSSDSAESHVNFIARHSLPFPLLTDRTGRVRRLYGVKRTFGLIPGRATFVIDREGIVRLAHSSQFAPLSHVGAALTVVRGLNKQDAP